MEKRLQALGAQDYTISLDKENGTVRVELAENDNVDMYIYYLYASQKITIKDTDSKDILLNDDMIKGAKYSYSNDSKGAYQVYEEIELTKDGQAKLNELLNDYALLATDVTEIENAKKASESESTKTESTSEENTESTENTDEQNTESTETQSTTEETSSNSETTKKTAKLYVNDTTYDISKIEKGKITVKIGASSSNTTSVNNNISKAAEIAMLENAGKLPADYEVDTNRYELFCNRNDSNISDNIISILCNIQKIRNISKYIICWICSIILIINKIYKCCNFNRRNKCNNNCYDN